MTEGKNLGIAGGFAFCPVLHHFYSFWSWPEGIYCITSCTLQSNIRHMSLMVLVETASSCLNRLKVLLGILWFFVRVYQFSDDLSSVFEAEERLK